MSSDLGLVRGITAFVGGPEAGHPLGPGTGRTQKRSRSLSTPSEAAAQCHGVLTRKAEMERNTDRERRTLQRIVALLVALAGLADRAAAAPFPIRFIVLAALRRAEGVAWTFALDALSGPAAHGAGRLPPWIGPTGQINSPADAVRLALSFRILALIVARWTARFLASVAVSPTAPCVLFLTHAYLVQGRRIGAALPPPDTS